MPDKKFGNLSADDMIKVVKAEKEAERLKIESVISKIKDLNPAVAEKTLKELLGGGGGLPKSDGGCGTFGCC